MIQPLPFELGRVGLALCTCDRAEYLDHLLATLARLYPHLSVYIADNGAHPSDRIIQRYRDSLNIEYTTVTTPGLCPARNRALGMAVAGGHPYIAFIDDDEWPDEGWQEALIETADSTGADIIYGPVHAAVTPETPDWIIKGAMLDRGEGQIGTYNLMIRASVLPANPSQWFHDAFSRVGSEDWEFIGRLEKHGATRAYAKKALVHEHVPPERRTVAHFLKRGWQQGAADTALIRHNAPTPLRGVLKCLAHALAKTAYAIDHFLRAPFARWHLVRGRMDLRTALAVLLALCGRQFSFYGNDAAPRKQDTHHGSD